MLLINYKNNFIADRICSAECSICKAQNIFLSLFINSDSRINIVNVFHVSIQRGSCSKLFEAFRTFKIPQLRMDPLDMFGESR